MTTDNTTYESHFYGTVKGVVIGNNNIVKIVFQDGTELTIPFLAPRVPNWELVGRDEILGDLKRRLFVGGNLALSALNGLPGVGKTALAVALAHDKEVLAHFQDGVLWAGLGREADVMSQLGRWGTTLGIGSDEMPKLTTVEARIERIRATIGTRRMLLVIDDAWESEPALALQVGGPNCAHLLTTRQPGIALDFAGEATTVKELSLEDGLALLKQFAPLAVEADPETAQKLVEAVGGLPLALILMGRYLEKAAYGAQDLGDALAKLHDVEERLLNEQSQAPFGHFPALSYGTKLSLLAMIAISDEALDQSARRAFYGLSVFPPKPNTFSQEAAIAVSAESTDALFTLTDYGLLESSGLGRYTLHQAIADYAKVNHTDEAADERMATYFVDYVGAHEKEYDVLEPETSNVVAALDMASERDMQIALVQGTNVFYHFLDVRGLYESAETLLTRAEQMAKTLDDITGLVTTWLNLGRTVEKQGNYTQAEVYLQKGLTLAQTLGDRERVSAFFLSWGTMKYKRGAYDQAESYYQKSLTLARELKHRERITLLLLNLGVLEDERGAYDQAMSYYSEGLVVARELEDRVVICRLLGNLGTLAGNSGEYDKAKAYFQDSLAVGQELGDQEVLISMLLNLGVLAELGGNYTQAKTHLQEALRMARKIGHLEKICFVLQNLGEVLRIQEAYEEAEVYLQEGLVLARQMGHNERISGMLIYLGHLMTSRGVYEQAESYLQEGLTMTQELGHHWLTNYALVALGNLYLKQSNLASATTAFSKSLKLSKSAGHQDFFAETLYGLAQVAFAQSDMASARQQAQESLTIFDKIGHRDANEVKAWLAKLDDKPEE